MSALTFMKSLTQKIAQQEPSVVQSTVISSNQQKTQEKPQKKKFTHGKNIIMKTGTYKGYYGFVYDFHPAKFEVEIEETQYIPKNAIDQFPNAKIVEEIPKLYVINVSKSELPFEVRMPGTGLMTVVAYKDNETIRLANYVNTRNDECDLVLLNTSVNLVSEFEKLKIVEKENKKDDSQIIQMLLENLSEQIKNNTLEPQMSISCDKSKIISPEYYFVLYKSSNVNDPNYQGEYGKLVKIIDEQYLIKTNRSIMFAKGDIREVKSDKTVILKHQSYKDKNAKFVKKHPAYLSVFIDAIGKKVNSHLVEINGKYAHRPITPNDVFYMDLLLKNGNLFEVKDIFDDKIIGVEKADRYIPREITENDIESYQPGFILSSDISESGPSAQEESEEFVYDEDNLDKELEDDEEEVEEDVQDAEEYMKLFEEEGEEQEYKASYKDAERTFVAKTQLSKKQLELKNKIDTILGLYGLNEDVNVYNLITAVEQMIEKFQNLLQKANIVFWKGSDEKFIIATIVLHEIVKKGYGSSIASPKQDLLTKYISDLSEKKKFFNKKDIDQSILLQNNWTDMFTVNDTILKSLVKSKDFSQLYKLIIENTLKIVEYYIGKINMESRYIVKEADLIPLGKKKVEIVKLIYPKDLVSGNIPDTAERIFWGKNFIRLISQYKESIANKINTSTSNTNKVVYEYVLNNLERAPFALKELEDSIKKTNLKIEQLKYNTLKTVYNQLLEKIEKIIKLKEAEKEKTLSDIVEEKEKMLKRRREVSKTKELISDLENLELDDTQSTKKQK